MMLSSLDVPKLQWYVDNLRPIIDPNNHSDKLLVLAGPKELYNLSTHLKSLGKRYGFQAPSATIVRKIGATTVVLKCGEQDKALITRQMSHTANTQVRHYEGVVGPVHAASAFRKMEKLRNKSEDKQTSSTDCPPSGSRPTPWQKYLRFTPEEQRDLKEYFAEEIAAKQTPTLQSCREYLRDHPIGRTVQQIQDKVKTIIKYS